MSSSQFLVCHRELIYHWQYFDITLLFSCRCFSESTDYLFPYFSAFSLIRTCYVKMRNNQWLFRGWEGFLLRLRDSNVRQRNFFFFKILCSKSCPLSKSLESQEFEELTIIVKDEKEGLHTLGKVINARWISHPRIRKYFQEAVTGKWDLTL